MSADVWRRCRHGRHAWRFVSMSDVREVTVAPHTAWICRLVERCDRCGLRRTRQHAEIPKRPRISTRPEGSTEP